MRPIASRRCAPGALVAAPLLRCAFAASGKRLPGLKLQLSHEFRPTPCLQATQGTAAQVHAGEGIPGAGQDAPCSSERPVCPSCQALSFPLGRIDASNAPGGCSDATSAQRAAALCYALSPPLLHPAAPANRHSCARSLRAEDASHHQEGGGRRSDRHTQGGQAPHQPVSAGPARAGRLGGACPHDGCSGA